jgi:UPF0042 nucleotide-binding protein
MDIIIFSFGHKYGQPPGSDLQFDTRPLPNPYRIHDLRQLTGKDEAVQAWFEQFPRITTFLDRAARLAQDGIDNEARRALGGYQYRIGFGCTGGHHRSVYCAEQLAILLRDSQKNEGHSISVVHTQHPEKTE